MSAKIIDGKALAARVKSEVRAAVDAMLTNGLRRPGLAVVMVGDNAASEVYVHNKRKSCDESGLYSVAHDLPASTSQSALLDLVQSLNRDPKIDGILVQLPLPKQINANAIIEAIDPQKDVDGFHPYNLGRLAQRQPLLRPCTPYGVTKLLEVTGEKIAGKHCVIVGASNIVGRPMALELLLLGGTVTICHSRSGNLEPYVRSADVLIAAVGILGLVRGEWVKPGSIVIDVGMHRLPDGKLCGDIDYEAAYERAGWITPVPGGVGPMTVAMLMKNSLESAERRLAATDGATR
jgi:methylenetetrahydrofolate dehydrogenase (NADP+) / methenyltetrahydrofolate cyclohydrolase